MNPDPVHPSPWKEAPLYAVLLLMGTAYALLSLNRHWHFGSGGYDLGLFDQVVWSLSRFHAPASTIRGFPNILGDHFEPILFAIAPFYWLLDAPETLILLQPAALCLSAVAVFAFSRRRVGRVSAYFWTVGYLFFWGFQSGINSDFHPEFLALPMLAFAIDLHDRGRWRPAFACLLLLLTVKEDMGLLVAAFGVHLMVLGEWRRAWWAVGSGLAGFWLSFGLLVPYFAEPQPYQYSGRYSELGADKGEVLRTLFLRPWAVVRILFSDVQKAMTMFYSFLSSGFGAFLSPLVVMAIPFLAERMLSNYPTAWGRAAHYSVMMGPILFMAGVDGFHRAGRRFFGGALPRAAILAVSGSVLLFNLATAARFPLKELVDARTYERTPVHDAGREALAMVPPDASVMAQNAIVAHLSHRQGIYVYRVERMGRDYDYVIACERLNGWPFEDFAPLREDLEKRIAGGGYSVIFKKEGWIVLRRRPGTFGP